jgi:phosphoenolpyruvate carboxylase
VSNFRDAFRQGRAQAREARGAAAIPYAPQVEPADALYERIDQNEQSETTLAELEKALRDRETEAAEAKRLLAEMTDYAGKLQDRVVELIATSEPLAKTLRLPGVKTFLLNRFHPDKHPTADEKQRELLTEALKTITAAYALAGELQTSD